MEGKNNKEEPVTLETGLNFWSRQEQKFQSLFGKEALKDKEFLKMKLRYYDSLWYNYKGATLGTEGLLMMNMLKFQRKKLEKSLHRGPLRKIIRRINTAIGSRSALKARRKMENRNRLERYNQDSPKPEAQEKAKDSIAEQQTREQIDDNKSIVEKEQRRADNARRQTRSYAYNQSLRDKHKTRKSNGIHH